MKNSPKFCGFRLFSCWQLWFHEKNCSKIQFWPNSIFTSFSWEIKVEFFGTKNEDFEECRYLNADESIQCIEIGLWCPIRMVRVLADHPCLCGKSTLLRQDSNLIFSGSRFSILIFWQSWFWKIKDKCNVNVLAASNPKFNFDKTPTFSRVFLPIFKVVKS